MHWTPFLNLFRYDIIKICCWENQGISAVPKQKEKKTNKKFILADLHTTKMHYSDPDLMAYSQFTKLRTQKVLNICFTKFLKKSPFCIVNKFLYLIHPLSSLVALPSLQGNQSFAYGFLAKIIFTVCSILAEIKYINISSVHQVKNRALHHSHDILELWATYCVAGIFRKANILLFCTFYTYSRSEEFTVAPRCNQHSPEQYNGSIFEGLNLGFVT